MSSQRLSVRQVEVLARLVAGESISRVNSDLRVTVYALRNRGPVVTPCQAEGGWFVELTEVGREAASTGRVPERLPRPRGHARATAQPGVTEPELTQPGVVSPVLSDDDEAAPARGRTGPNPVTEAGLGAVHGGPCDPRGAAGRSPG